MKISIRTKFLLMSILIVLVTTIGISTAYYLLTRDNQHRASEDRVRIAFEVILDDIARRLSTYSARFDEFLQGDMNLRMAVRSYNRNTGWIGEKNYISRYLKKAADDLKRFGTAISANRLLLYANDTRLLAVYQREGAQEILGGYVASLAGNNTFIPLDDSPESRAILFGNTGDFSEAPLPSGISPSYGRDIPDTLSSELFRKDQRLGMMITSPIYRNEEKIGVLVGEIWFSQDIVERYASLSKTAVNLFAGAQLSIGTLSAQERIDPEAMRQIESCEDILTQDATTRIFSVTFEEREYYQGQCTLSNAQGVIGAITVSLSQEFEKQENKKILTAILAISVIIIALAFGLSVLISRKTIRSIYDIVNVIARAAEGDLTETATVMTRDEIGMLASKLNQMIAQLRNVSGQVQETSSSVNAIADVVLRQMESLIRNMERQSTSVDDTTNSTQEIDQFINVVADNTNDLLAASAQILASTQETQASIAEVTTSTDFLTKNLHLISSSVEQVNQSVRQIAENTEHLEEVAQHTETEIHHIDRSLKDVSSNADQAQQLAKETMEAATRGQSSVEAAIHGMSDLKDVVANTDQIIREVNNWGERVSSILDIVDDITEQTSLLALNASIISAQAGERGRGFAVVANEIKELATRTKTSTQEIGALIHELRMKTEEGVNNTAEGLKRADQGMQLASAVKDALNSILESATRSSNRAADTAQVTQQTAASSQTISARMNEVTVMVSTIKAAIQEGRKDIEQVINAVDNLSGMSEQVNRATLEQKRATEEIVRSMGTVTGQFDGISEQTEILQQHSDHIVAAMRAIESTTGQILDNATEISDDTVKALLQQADELQKSVTIFKVSTHASTQLRK